MSKMLKPSKSTEVRWRVLKLPPKEKWKRVIHCLIKSRAESQFVEVGREGDSPLVGLVIR